MKNSIFDFEGLDEMQKMQAYKLTHNFFKMTLYSMMILSLALVVGAWVIKKPHFAIAGIILQIFIRLIDTSFHNKIAALGIMNKVYAKQMSSPTYVMCYCASFIFFIVLTTTKRFDNSDIFVIMFCIYFFIATVGEFSKCYAAKKNLKTLEEAEKADEEE